MVENYMEPFVKCILYAYYRHMQELNINIATTINPQGGALHSTTLIVLI